MTSLLPVFHDLKGKRSVVGTGNKSVVGLLGCSFDQMV